MPSSSMYYLLKKYKTKKQKKRNATQEIAVTAFAAGAEWTRIENIIRKKILAEQLLKWLVFEPLKTKK